MKLTKVTITGADDRTSSAELDRLTVEFPFVEWALLASPTRAGTPRYPSVACLARLGVGMPTTNFAYHLCGAAARRALAGEGPPGRSAPRIQVNGFSRHVDEHGPLTPFGEWVSHVRSSGTEVILQVAHERALAVARLLGEVHPNISALWDESGGTGLVTWLDALPGPPAGLRLGYAGGIGPDNVGEICGLIVRHPSAQETWIDMESGVRTEDDVLDLDKVHAVLERAAPYVHRPPEKGTSN